MQGRVSKKCKCVCGVQRCSGGRYAPPGSGSPSHHSRAVKYTSAGWASVRTTTHENVSGAEERAGPLRDRARLLPARPRRN